MRKKERMNIEDRMSLFAEVTRALQLRRGKPVRVEISHRGSGDAEIGDFESVVVDGAEVLDDEIGLDGRALEIGFSVGATPVATIFAHEGLLLGGDVSPALVQLDLGGVCVSIWSL
jgi:hypothetical protein